MKIIDGFQKGQKLRRFGVVAVSLLFVTAPRTCLASSGDRVTLGFELGADRSKRAYDPKQIHEEQG